MAAGDADRRTQPNRALRPKDAATLVVVDRSGTEPRVLMGRRRADLVFLPNMYVFPGGRVDAADRTAPAADALDPDVEARLLIEMRGRPTARRARSLAMAAIREAFEETGIVIGTPWPGAPPASPPSPQHESDLPASPWRDFLAEGYLPRPGAVSLLARAITPPGRPRRYDTRFFVADATSIATRRDHLDGELSGVDWFTFDAMRALDLPRITRVIIEDLADHLRHADNGSRRRPIPFYFFRAGSFRRTLLSQDETAT